MGFDVIPAIDVSDGRLCRLAMGGPARVEAFGGSPDAAAEAFVAAGARWLHVVDVDLAFEGVLRNVDVVTRLSGLGAQIQASGGVRSELEARRLLDAGASRVVLGSAAMTDFASVTLLADSLGDKLVVGVETEGGRVRPRGRDRELNFGVGDAVAWLKDSPVALVLHTNVRRVGQLGGPDLEGLRTVLGSGKRVLAAGGIAAVTDLEAVCDTGAVGAVVGRVALEGTLDLRGAISAFASRG